MILDIKKYDRIDAMLTEGNTQQILEILNNLNDSLTDELTSLFIKFKYNEIKEELNISKRYKSLLKTLYTTDINFSMGYFHALTDVFSILIANQAEKNTFEKKMMGLSEKAYVKQILFFLLDHPDAQHKVIAQSIQVSTSYLSQLMRELEDIGCVERYAAGKRSFYSLSLDGQAFTKRLREESKGWNSDCIQYDFASNYIYSILDQEKYSVPSTPDLSPSLNLSTVRENEISYNKNTFSTTYQTQQIISDLNDIDTLWTQEIKHTKRIGDLKNDIQKQKIAELLYVIRNYEKSGNTNKIKEFKKQINDDETSDYLLNYANSSLVYYFNLSQMRELEKKDNKKVQAFLKETLEKYVIRLEPTYISLYQEYHFPDKESVRSTLHTIEFLTKYYVYHLFGKEYISRDFQQETGLSQQNCDYYANLVEQNFNQIKINLVLQNGPKGRWMQKSDAIL